VPPRPHEVTPTHVAELNEVTKGFGTGAARRTVLGGVSALVTAGTLTALTGRSGAGKSTLLHLIAGMTRPDGGEIHVLGSRIDRLDRAATAAMRRSGVALVTQDVGLVPFLSAAENVVLAMEIRGAPTDADLARSTLAEVGLDGRADHLVEHLSAGERQRAALARALAAHPALLLVDEPTSRLDRPNARAIADLLVAISRRHGTAVICATHDDEIIGRADAMIDLDDSTAPAAA
jgi:ABC-type lipoprotein export system ATPase subunit